MTRAQPIRREADKQAFPDMVLRTTNAYKMNRELPQAVKHSVPTGIGFGREGRGHGMAAKRASHYGVITEYYLLICEYSYMAIIARNFLRSQLQIVNRRISAGGFLELPNKQGSYAGTSTAAGGHFEGPYFFAFYIWRSRLLCLGKVYARSLEGIVGRFMRV